MSVKRKIATWIYAVCGIAVVILMMIAYSCENKSKYINGSEKSTYVVIDSSYSSRYGTVLTVQDETGFSIDIIAETEEELKLSIGDILYE